ncbi:MAG: YraN family protein [Bacteroidales bacterium]|nr:YraN family protein [Bacteroidales bacterium]
MAIHNEIGEKGELLAADYLRKKNYKIVATNWRYQHKEIDIIAYDGNILVIVEVKLRSSNYFGDPSESVTKKKQRLLVKAADAYVDSLDEEPEVRFDVISITTSDGEFDIEHIDDAFIA